MPLSQQAAQEIVELVDRLSAASQLLVEFIGSMPNDRIVTVDERTAIIRRFNHIMRNGVGMRWDGP